jgi:hypothetical protein
MLRQKKDADGRHDEQPLRIKHHHPFAAIMVDMVAHHCPRVVGHVSGASHTPTTSLSSPHFRSKDDVAKMQALADRINQMKIPTQCK